MATAVALCPVVVSAQDAGAKDAKAVQGNTQASPDLKASGAATAKAGDAKVESKLEVKVSGTNEAPPEAPKKAESPVDKALMRALEEEYEGDNATRATPSMRRRGNLTRRDVIIVEEEPEPEWTRLRLQISYWYATLDDVEITSRFGDLSNTFDATSSDLADFEDEDEDDDLGQGSLLFQAEIGLHPVVSLTGLYYKAEFQSTQTLRNQNFVFAGQAFAQGDQLRSEVTITAIEGNLAVHALRLDWMRFDILLGARYMKTEIEYSRVGDASSLGRQRFEMVTPLIGIGMVVRPWSWFELYGSIQGGALEYEDSGDDDDFIVRPEDTEERYLAILIVDVGARINFSNCFGIGLGIRAEAFEQESFRGNFASNVVEGTLGGPYVSLFFGF